MPEIGRKKASSGNAVERKMGPQGSTFNFDGLLAKKSVYTVQSWTSTPIGTRWQQYCTMPRIDVAAGKVIVGWKMMREREGKRNKKINENKSFRPLNDFFILFTFPHCFMQFSSGSFFWIRLIKVALFGWIRFQWLELVLRRVRSLMRSGDQVGPECK